MIEAIVAIGRGGVIGNQGDLPWPRLPADMQHFRSVTQGKTVVMGRKTAESLPGPLQGRRNRVITSNGEWRHASGGVFQVRRWMYGLSEPHPKYPSLVIIGGAQIYRLYAPYVTTVHVTTIHGDFEGDTFFPMDAFGGEWKMVSEVLRSADKENAYDLTFATFRRNS